MKPNIRLVPAIILMLVINILLFIFFNWLDKLI